MAGSEMKGRSHKMKINKHQWAEHFSDLSWSQTFRPCTHSTATIFRHSRHRLCINVFCICLCKCLDGSENLSSCEIQHFQLPRVGHIISDPGSLLSTCSIYRIIHNIYVYIYIYTHYTYITSIYVCILCFYIICCLPIYIYVSYIIFTYIYILFLHHFRQTNEILWAMIFTHMFFYIDEVSNGSPIMKSIFSAHWVGSHDLRRWLVRLWILTLENWRML